MSEIESPQTAADTDLSPEEARAVIETIADVEREEAAEVQTEGTN